jgi:putative ABC transport system permease protein
MLINYFKTALRNNFKHKGYSLINISGLAIGMATCLLILLYVNHELSYDNYNEDADRIYRIAFSGRWGGREFDVCTAPAPMAKVILETYPEIEEAVRFRDQGSFIIQYGDKTYKENRIIFADASFFDIFTVPLLKGDSQTALKEPYTLVLSRKTAEKYFQDENPIGKTLRLDDREDYKVTGVFDEIPDNSHFHYDILLSMESHEESRDQIWLSMNFPTYIRLHEEADYKTLEAKFDELIKKYAAPQMSAFMGSSAEKLIEKGEILAKYFLQPLRSIHLHSDFLGEMEPTSDAKYVYIFSAIALFIVIIACINFMNLSTARSAGRAKEVGVRKVLGSFRIQLIGQFLTESNPFALQSPLWENPGNGEFGPKPHDFYRPGNHDDHRIPGRGLSRFFYLCVSACQCAKRPFANRCEGRVVQERTRRVPVYSLNHIDHRHFYRLQPAPLHPE